MEKFALNLFVTLFIGGGMRGSVRIDDICSMSVEYIGRIYRGMRRRRWTSGAGKKEDLFPVFL